MARNTTTDNQETDDHWEDDKLGRKDQAKLLTSFIEQQHKRMLTEEKPRHFVLNINSSWGFGKTFFLDRWQKDLEGKHHLVLSFNAWENDYAKDPLMSFLYEISTQLTSRLQEVAEQDANARAIENTANCQDAGNKLTNFIQENGYKLLRSGLSIATGIQLPEGIGISDPFEAEKERKNAINTFKDELRNVIDAIARHEAAENSIFKLPLFIFVDELDRCRPDFTIELIEVVKHIFNVDDIFFVFATDGDQLQASLQGMYGNGFEAEIYFNRIFSREVHLCLPDNFQFAQALANEYAMFTYSEDLNALITASITDGGSEADSFYRDFEWVSDVFGLTMRDQHQMAAAFDVLNKTRVVNGDKTFTVAALVLIFLWQHKKQLFRELVSDPQKYVSGEALSSKLGELNAFDNNRTQLIACPLEDSFSHEQVPITEVIGGFLSLMTCEAEQIRNLRCGESRTYLFIHHICESARPPSRRDPQQGIPSLRTMINQILLAA